MRLSLTDFTDFVAATAESKMTKLRAVKTRPEYAPALDYYRGARLGIIEAARSQALPSVEDLMGHPDSRKLRHYTAIAKGAAKWFRQQSKWDWVEPDRSIWEVGALQVNVNPEIALVVNGTPHVVKLYFKEEKLPKRRADIVAHLMQQTMCDGAAPGTRFGILDVRRARFHVQPEPPRDLDLHLRGEAGYILGTWDQL